MQRQYQTLFPIDTEKGRNARPIGQQIAIFAVAVFAIVMVFGS